MCRLGTDFFAAVELTFKQFQVDRLRSYWLAKLAAAVFVCLLNSRWYISFFKEEIWEHVEEQD